MGLVEKINKKYRYIQSNWKADIRFSKKYAKLRRKDIISSTIGLKNKCYVFASHPSVAWISSRIRY